MPEEIEFKTKPQIALEQIKWACRAGLPRGVVSIEAGYGVEAKFRIEISASKLKYVAGVKTTNTVWAPAKFASPQSGNSRRGSDESMPMHVEKLALALPKSSWRTIRWRDGTNEVLSSRLPGQDPFGARSRCCEENGSRAMAID